MIIELAYINNALRREHAEILETEKVYKNKFLEMYDER